MEGEPALWSVPRAELHLHRRRLRADLRSLARALRCSTTQSAGDDRAIQLCPPSAICRLHSDHVRFPLAVADDFDAGDVSRAGMDVCAFGTARGARRFGDFWQGI